MRTTKPSSIMFEIILGFWESITLVFYSLQTFQGSMPSSSFLIPGHGRSKRTLETQRLNAADHARDPASVETLIAYYRSFKNTHGQNWHNKISYSHALVDKGYSITKQTHIQRPSNIIPDVEVMNAFPLKSELFGINLMKAVRGFYL